MQAFQGKDHSAHPEPLRMPLARMVVRRVEKNQYDNFMYGLEFER